jgi:hypothetical protein
MTHTWIRAMLWEQEHGEVRGKWDILPMCLASQPYFHIMQAPGCLLHVHLKKGIRAHVSTYGACMYLVKKHQVLYSMQKDVIIFKGSILLVQSPT